MPFFNVSQNRRHKLFQRASRFTQPLRDIVLHLIPSVHIVTGHCIKDWGDSREDWLTCDQVVLYEQISALNKREQDSGALHSVEVRASDVSGFQSHVC